MGYEFKIVCIVVNYNDFFYNRFIYKCELVCIGVLYILINIYKLVQLFLVMLLFYVNKFSKSQCFFQDFMGVQNSILQLVKNLLF